MQPLQYSCNNTFGQYEPFTSSRIILIFFCWNYFYLIIRYINFIFKRASTQVHPTCQWLSSFWIANDGAKRRMTSDFSMRRFFKTVDNRGDIFVQYDLCRSYNDLCIPIYLVKKVGYCIIVIYCIFDNKILNSIFTVICYVVLWIYSNFIMIVSNFMSNFLLSNHWNRSTVCFGRQPDSKLDTKINYNLLRVKFFHPAKFSWPRLKTDAMYGKHTDRRTYRQTDKQTYVRTYIQECIFIYR